MSSEFPQGWISGCYGLERPATLIASNVVVYRKMWHWRPRWPFLIRTTYILTARRGEGRWEADLPIMAHGGFVNPGENPYATAVMELREEVPGMEVEVESLPFFLTTSDGMRYRWNPRTRQAEVTNQRAQDVPIVTAEYWGKWISGTPQASDEALDLHWEPVSNIVSRDDDWAFNMALIIPELIKKFL